jgi:hypothetical protein
MSESLSMADALAEQARIVRRLSTRVLKYTGQIESTLASVRQSVEAGDLDRLNDLGELQSAATGYEAAVGALSQAHEALKLMKTIERWERASPRLRPRNLGPHRSVDLGPVGGPAPPPVRRLARLSPVAAGVLCQPGGVP